MSDESCCCGDEPPNYTVSFCGIDVPTLADPNGCVIYVSKECYDAQVLDLQKELVLLRDAKDLEIGKLKRRIELKNGSQFLLTLAFAFALLGWWFK